MKNYKLQGKFDHDLLPLICAFTAIIIGLIGLGFLALLTVLFK